MEGTDLVSPLPANEHLLIMLRENSHNWFAFVEELKMMLCNYTPEHLNQALTDFLAFLPSSDLSNEENWVDVGEGLTEKMKSLVVNEKKKQKKRDRRRFLKLMAEKSLLKRKVPKRASKLLKQFPSLGKDIEDFVHENRIGADARESLVMEQLSSCQLSEIRGANPPNAIGVQHR